MTSLHGSSQNVCDARKAPFPDSISGVCHSFLLGAHTPSLIPQRTGVLSHFQLKPSHVLSLEQGTRGKLPIPRMGSTPLKGGNHQTLQLRVITRTLNLFRRRTCLQALGRIALWCSRRLILLTALQDLLWISVTLSQEFAAMVLASLSAPLRTSGQDFLTDHHLRPVSTVLSSCLHRPNASFLDRISSRSASKLLC